MARTDSVLPLFDVAVVVADAVNAAAADLAWILIAERLVASVAVELYLVEE